MPRLYSTIAALLLFLPLLASGAEKGRKPDPLFASHDILEITIEAPFGALMKDRPEEEELPGKVTFAADDGSVQELDVAIRTRGKFRQKRSTCPFAPLRLNFKKSQTDDTVFDKQDKIKLVTHCRSGSSKYQQTVLTEYLAYRIFNLISDYSFSARLLHVTYKYNDQNRETQGYAILIESKARLAKRIGIPLLATSSITTSKVQPADLNLSSFFQYLIGNTDFSPIHSLEGLDCCHNYALYQNEGDLIHAIPYDFDQSGIVDAPHAVVNPRFKIKGPRQRLYRGRCVNNEYLPVTRGRFLDKREEITTLINDQPGLQSGTRKKTATFVRKFFEILSNDKRYAREIVKKCI